MRLATLGRAAIWAIMLATGPSLMAQCSNPRCSAVIPTAAASASISVGPGRLDRASFRIEARLHGQNWAAANTVPTIFSVGGYGVQSIGGLLFFLAPDNISSGIGNCAIRTDSARPTDMTVRITRDAVASILTGEAFATQSGASIGTCTFAINVLAAGSAIVNNGVTVGGANASGDLAFLRWFSELTTIGSAVAVGIGQAADYLDYEFSPSPGSQNDTNLSGFNGQNLHGISSFANTPTYNPACSAGTQQVINSGSILQLDGSSSTALDGNPTLSYSWAYQPGVDGVNQGAIIANNHVALATASHLLTFGSANFQLTVTDGSGNSTSCTVHHGVVPFDGHGVVNMVAEGRTPAQIAIGGPLIALGQNPWPWADTVTVSELNLQSCNLGLAGFTGCASPNSYSPYWTNFKPGTITLTSGSATVTGTSTNFLSTICTSGGSPAAGKLIWRYTGTDDLTHYTELAISGCTDDTHLTLATAYPTPANLPMFWPDCTGACSGLAWNFEDGTSPWAYNAAPGNYYDNLEFFLRSYWRTGWDTAFLAAQTMANDWLQIPMNDFANCDPNVPIVGNGFLTCFIGDPGRAWSMTGIILWEEEGHSFLLPYLRNFWKLSISLLQRLPASNPPGLTDLRDNAYWLSFVAQCALVETDATQKTTCQNALKAALTNVFTPFKKTATVNGNTYTYWDRYYSTAVDSGVGSYSSVTSLGGSGSACVTNGSATVTGTGTSWPSTLQPVPFGGLAVIWFFANPGSLPANNAAGDNQVYIITNISGQTITLDRGYAGTTGCSGVSGSNKGFEISVTGALVGWGFQPFMESLLSQAFSYAGLAMDGADPFTQSTYQKYADQAIQAVVGLGATPPIASGGNGGLYNGAQFPGCSPSVNTASPVWQITMCLGLLNGYNSGPLAPTQSRTAALEAMAALALDYRIVQGANVLAEGDALMSQLFSKPGTGGPNPDGFFMSDFDTNGFFVNGVVPIGSAPKWDGQLCGYTGACAVWPAARTTVSVGRKPFAGQASIRGRGSITGQ